MVKVTGRPPGTFSSAPKVVTSGRLVLGVDLHLVLSMGVVTVIAMGTGALIHEEATQLCLITRVGPQLVRTVRIIAELSFWTEAVGAHLRFISKI